MKKKWLVLALFAPIALAICLAASNVVYTQYLVNEPALTSSTDFTLDLNSGGANGQSIDSISMQAVYSSATIAAVNFNDGEKGDGQITVLSTSSLTSAKSHNTITVGATSILTATKASNTITVATTTLTGAFVTLNGTKLRNGVDWFSTGTTSGTATALAALINTMPGVDAVSALNVVYTTAAVAGVAGNSYTLTSSTPAALTVGSANYAGGTNPALDNAYITINGKQLRNGYEWVVATTSSGTATNIAAVLDKVVNIDAVASGSVVYTTAAAVGTAGNAYTLTSSTPAALTVATALYAGGSDMASVTIGGITLRNGTDWTAVSTASGTAKAISDAIVANSTLSQIVTSTWASNVVYATATSVGALAYPLSSSIPASISTSSDVFTGGANSTYAINTGAVNVAGHGLGTGLGVVYTTGTAVGLSPLTYGTTYYAIRDSADIFKLATSKQNAINGTYITLTSSSTTGPHTFTLTPQAFAGTWGFSWSISNDGINFVDLPSVSSVTYSVPGTAMWDGPIGSRYLRISVDAGTSGALDLKVLGNGRNQ